MINRLLDNEIEGILHILKSEIDIAMGCTEPASVALAVAKACEVLNTTPSSVELLLSKNIIKNAMGVGIPGTGEIGLPMAIAIAINAGKSEKKLEVLDVGKEGVSLAKKWLAKNKNVISIKLKDTERKLYIECICKSENMTSKVIISEFHDRFELIQKNNEIIYENSNNNIDIEALKANVDLNIEKIINFVNQVNLDNINFIYNTLDTNKLVANEGMQGYGLNVGKILSEEFGNSVINKVISYTVSAIDARMSGCPMPVYSNSGSGNQGIVCSLPVYYYGVMMNYSKEDIIRSLTLSHLISIYIKIGFGRLSAMCGIINASIAVAAGIVFYKKKDIKYIHYVINNMTNTLAGMICDGAKPSCSLKVATCLYAAFICVELAVREKVVNATDGIADINAEKSIKNIAKIACKALENADNVILEILTEKNK